MNECDRANMIIRVGFNETAKRRVPSMTVEFVKKADLE
jgi:hypothetical protein